MAEAAADALASMISASSSSRENLGRAWSLLGQRLRDEDGGDASIMIGDDHVRPVDCFTRALGLLPPAKENAFVWRDLADELEGQTPDAAEDDAADEEAGGPASIRVQGLPHSAIACRCRAVEADPSNNETWTLLGQALTKWTPPAPPSAETGDNAKNEDSAGPVEDTCETTRVEMLACKRVLQVFIDRVKPAKQPPVPFITPIQCFTTVLNNDVSFTEAWFFVAEELAAREERSGAPWGTLKVGVAGKAFAAWQCLVEGLKREPKAYGSAWVNLARWLPADKESVRVGNSAGHFTRLQCLIQALAIDDSDAETWLALALLMVHASSQPGAARMVVQHERRKLAALDCFVHALSQDNTLVDAWVGTALELRGTTPRLASSSSSQQHQQGSSRPSITVGEVEVTELDCYLAALRLDAKSAVAWHGLGVELDARDGLRAELEVDGETVEVGPLESMLRAVELDAKDAATWNDLARLMPTGGAVDVAGWQRSQIDCFAEAANLDPNDHDCWIGLAEALVRGGVVKVGDRAVGQLRCYAEAARCNPNDAVAWANVGVLLTPGADIDVADQARGLKNLDCFARSLRLNRKQAAVWRNLASVLAAAKQSNELADGSSDDEGPDGEPAPAHEALATEIDVFGDGELYDASRCEAEANLIEGHHGKETEATATS